ncbi:MAG TPA: SIR2 family protein [Candidatus Acidoferrales bacterium]|jgi:hypothetical protein|nr:SIR2 family protein [Candidatus Acidoferrales bacterium]
MSSDDGLRPIDVDPHTRRKPAHDDNFVNFSDNWKHYENRLVLFLGAGASVGARNHMGNPLPTAFHMRNGLWQQFMTPDGTKFEPESIGLVSLEHAAALVERSAGRDALMRYVVDYFQTAAPLWQHAVLPYLKPKAIFTTNYDNLIEAGWRLHGSAEGIGDFRLYYRHEDPDQSRAVPLYKPHGTIDCAKKQIGDGGLVLTQFDYLTMLDVRRSALKKCLQSLDSACVLFIGYSFQDFDIASELFGMRNPNHRRAIPWYAVFPRNDTNVRAMYDERYGIRQINRTFLDFMADLDDTQAFIPKTRYTSLYS